jgi:mono/diheme cytochrome c family protein
MRHTLASLVIAALVVVLSGLAFIYSGIYDVAATDPHWPLTRWALETSRIRSIKAHVAGIHAPPTLNDPAMIGIGVEHFAAHCAVCHGAPGVPRGEIAEGLYPQPLDLTLAAKLYSDTELFWILKHGIKMTGMPAWSDHSDEELWATVAFLRQLPVMSKEEYMRLVVASMAHGGHRDAGHGDPHLPTSNSAPPSGPSQDHLHR